MAKKKEVQKKAKKEAGEVDVVYKNTLNGTLKIDHVVFPGKGSLPLTDDQASTKRMKHAIDCGVVVKA